jgi:hypothetical protein
MTQRSFFVATAGKAVDVIDLAYQIPIWFFVWQEPALW